MFHELQETWVESLKRHLSAWKKEGIKGQPMSENTMFDLIVEAHERIGGPRKTGIHFNNGPDAYNRQKANAIRIKRLLTDEPVGEEQSDQLVNLMPSILAAMPSHLRISFLNEYLAPLDLHVAGNEEATEGEVGIADLAEIMRKDAQTHQTIAQVIDNPELAVLTAAHKDILDSIETKKRKGRVIQAMIRAKTATGCAIKRAGGFAGNAINKLRRKEVA